MLEFLNNWNLMAYVYFAVFVAVVIFAIYWYLTHDGK